MTYLQQREAILKQMEGIVAVIETENRGLSDQEDAEYADLRGRLQRLDDFEAAKQPVGQLRTIAAPALHLGGDHNTYSILRAVQYMLRPHLGGAGAEVEVARELERRNPSQSFKGFPIPTAALLGMVHKAPPGLGASPPSGLTTTSEPNQLDPLTAVGNLDNLFQRKDTAIIPTDPLAGLGMQQVVGLTERQHDVPTMTAPLTASHVLIDTALAASSDPAFANRPLTPKLCGSLCTLLLSSIFARHPVVDENWLGTELRSAIFAELTRVRLSGDAVAHPAEPDGLVSAATTATQSTIELDGGQTAVANGLAVATQLATYLHSDLKGVASWILPRVFEDNLKKALTLTDASNNIAVLPPVVPMTPGSFCDLPYISQTAISTPAFLGDYSTCVSGYWMAADVMANPYGSTDFARGSVQLRVVLLHDFLVRDVKRILKATVS